MTGSHALHTRICWPRGVRYQMLVAVAGEFRSCSWYTCAKEVENSVRLLRSLAFLYLVHGGKLLRDVLLGDVGRTRVHNIDHELLATQQRVVLKLARAHRDETHLVLPDERGVYRLRLYLFPCGGY